MAQRIVERFATNRALRSHRTCLGALPQQSRPPAPRFDFGASLHRHPVMEKPPLTLCQHCRQQEATVHLTRMISRMRRSEGSAPPATPGAAKLPERPGDVTHVDLCESCAIATGAIPQL